MALKKWAKGSQTASYFASSGTTFTGSTVSIPAEGIYTIYAKDNAGNEAVQTISLSFDSTPPDGHGTPSTENWTNQDVIIHFTATDSGSGVKSITLPDGQTVNAASADYTVSANGTYNFIATDNAGNKKTFPVSVTNIDKTAPTGAGTLSKTKWTCGNVGISFTAWDDLSGVASIKTPDGTVINGSTTSYIATENGTYNFTVQDNAGNTAVVPVIVSNIDRAVSVTHPLAVNYTIDPNNETFLGNDISIKNNSQHIGVSVAVQDFTTSGINNVLPDSISDWRALTAAQTAGSISLGIAVKESAPTAGGWNVISQAAPFYSAGTENPVQLGVINVNGEGNLQLSAKYGLAWANKTTVHHNITLMFNCADVE